MRPWTFAALLLVACSPNTQVFLPSGDARAVALLESGKNEVTTHDVDGPLQIEFDDGITHLFLYTQTLAELSLPRGSLTRAKDVEGLPIPRPSQAFEVRSDSPDATETTPEASPLYPEFRAERTSPELCAHQGGCFLSPDSIACTFPCPDPSDIAAPTPPDLPSPPVFTPCPPGWRLTDHGSCAGLPENFDGCPEGQLITPGTSCQTLTSCRTPEPPEGAVYVDPTANPGGDGTSAHPFRTLAEVTAASVVVLSPGRHLGTVTSSITLIGTCPEQTTLEGTLEVPGFLGISGLRLDHSSLVIAPGATAILQGVELSATTVVSQGAITFENVSVRSSPGLRITGGSVDASRLMIWDVSGSGFDIADASITLRDTVVGRTGQGMIARRSQLSLERTVLFQNEYCSLHVLDGSEALVRDTEIHSTLSVASTPDSNSGGVGVIAFSDAFTRPPKLDLRRTTIEDSRRFAIWAYSSTIALSDVRVAGVIRDEKSGEFGSGLGFENSFVTIDRAHVEDVVRIGLDLWHQGQIRVRDIKFTHLGVPLDVGSSAITLADTGTELDIQRVLIEDIERAGIVANFGASVRGQDISIISNTSGPDTSGMWFGRAQGEFDRVFVSGTSYTGLAGVESSEVVARDLHFVRTGDGLMTEKTGRMHAERVLLESVGGTALRMEGGELRVRDVIAKDTEGRTREECTYIACLGTGALASKGTLDLERFRITNSRVDGLAILLLSDVRLVDGVIEGNEVGVDHVAGVDLRSLLHRVRYDDNRLTFTVR